MIRIRTAAAIKRAGSNSKLAKLLGVTRSAVSQWGEWMPPYRALQLRMLRPRWMQEIAE